MSSRARNVAILLIVAFGALLRSVDLMRPWVGMHNGWGGAMYGNIARNFVKYGYWATEFGPVANTGYVSPEYFEYYYHYPSMLVWSVSASFQVFGVHEWSARLVPLAFSLALMGLVFGLARRLFSEEAALIALLFSAILPVEAYYGAHVDVYGSIVVFFTTLALYGYARWLETSRSRDFALCLIGVVFGCMTAWFTFFLVPLIIGHYLFVHRPHDHPRNRQIWLIAACAIAVFLLFVLHRRMLMAGGRSEIEGTLLEKLLIRMSLDTPSGSVSLGGLAVKHARDLVRLYSIPSLLLGVAWTVFFVTDAVKRRLQTADWLVLILLGYGFLHNAAFPSFLLGHEFMAVCYVPGLAIAAAAALVRVGAHVEQNWGRRARYGVVAAALLVTAAASLSSVRDLYASDSNHAVNLKRWGDAIRATSADTDLVLACSPDDRIFQYYIDREIVFSIDTPEKFRNATLRRPARLFACPARWAEAKPDVLGFLDELYSRRVVGGDLVLFDLRK